ncbi:MAG: P1 family peptidase [Streptosporangiales bacterium]
MDTTARLSGFAVGHDGRADSAWLTGTTVILCPQGTVGGVDQRGGAPGTRETDLLDPRNLVDRVDAVVLTGGSAYGLEAAGGAMRWLAEHGRGWPIGPAVVPIVPAAVIFDLGRAGRYDRWPDAAFGSRACEAARAVTPDTPPHRGNVGAGIGAVVGGLKGGVGWAVASAGTATVAALVVVNAAGSAVDPASGRLYADLDRTLPEPDATAVARLKAASAPKPPLNTTIGAVLTDARLDKARCQKLAGTAQDGLARAIRPAHTMADGDTVFALASGSVQLDDLAAYDHLLAVGADCVTHAIRDAVLSAAPVSGFASYRELANVAP